MAKIFGTNGNDNLIGTGDDDEIFGWPENGSASTDSGEDTLRGGAGNDRLFGGGDDDFMIGDGGADIFTGGTGTDTVSYHTTSFGVTVDLVSGGQGGDAQGDLFGSIENVLGTVGNDNIFGDNAGNFLEGLDGADVFNGREGDDIIRGGAGADIISGGVGDDTATYNGSNAGVTINLAANTGAGGEAQGDTFGSVENIIGSNFADNITGDNAANHLFGQNGIDTLSGGTGNDTLEGGADNDILNGDSGNDILIGGAGADALNGGTGFDYVDYSRSGAGVNVTVGNTNPFGGDAQGDTLNSIEGVIGSNFADNISQLTSVMVVFAGGGNDNITGNGGGPSVTIHGGDGNDTMYGGTTGTDDFWGDAGDDTFVFFSDSSRPSHPDRIHDFEGAGGAGGDLVDFQFAVTFRGQLDFLAQPGATLAGAANGTADVYFTDDGVFTYVAVDFNDNGVLDDANDILVKFEGILSFSAADFI